MSFPYLSQQVLETIKAAEDDVCLFVDSGAFTAWKAGKTVSLDAYCKFIETLPVKPWRYFMLDVIGDPHATMRNYETMLQRGFNPVPVFTRGEDLSVLDEFYKTTDCVGLGGVAGSDKASYQWVRAVADHLGKRKYHILGMTSLDWIKYLKPYSCDSSSWNYVARYGNIQLYMGRGRVQWFIREDLQDGRDTKAIFERASRYGITRESLSKDSAWRGASKNGKNLGLALSACSWIDLSLDMRKALNTNLFLACAIADHVDVCIRQYQHIKQVHTAFAGRH